MEKLQSVNGPTIAGISQISPQQFVGKCHLSLPSTFKRVYTPPPEAISQQHTPHSFIHDASAVTGTPEHYYASMQQIPQTPDGRIAPALKLPSIPPKSLAGQQAPRTPGLLSFADGTKQQPSPTETPLPLSSSQTSVPVTPAYSIPVYYPSRFKRDEPEIGETLLGCGMLLLIGIITLAILFYLLM